MSSNKFIAFGFSKSSSLYSFGSKTLIFKYSSKNIFIILILRDSSHKAKHISNSSISFCVEIISNLGKRLIISSLNDK